MANVNHTPTPYTVVPDFKGHPALKSDNNIFAFFAPGGFKNDAQMIATAAFIVRAYNAHEALVAVATKISEFYAGTDAPIGKLASEALKYASAEPTDSKRWPT